MSKSRLQMAILAVLALVLVAAPAARASTIAVNFTNTAGPSLGNPPFTLGWSFTALHDIAVTSLGIFDAYGNGLNDAHPIGLWDSSGNLLVSTTIPAGTIVPLTDKFRFLAVTRTELTAGVKYYIGALYLDTDGLLFPGETTGFTTSSEIGFVAPQFVYNGTLTFPGNGGTGLPAYFGPNFEYDPIPEPATLLMLGVGLGLLARARRRS